MTTGLHTKATARVTYSNLGSLQSATALRDLVHPATAHHVDLCGRGFGISFVSVALPSLNGSRLMIGLVEKVLSWSHSAQQRSCPTWDGNREMEALTTVKITLSSSGGNFDYLHLLREITAFIRSRCNFKIVLDTLTSWILFFKILL